MAIFDTKIFCRFFLLILVVVINELFLRFSIKFYLRQTLQQQTEMMAYYTQFSLIFSFSDSMNYHFQS